MYFMAPKCVINQVISYCPSNESSVICFGHWPSAWTYTVTSDPVTWPIGNHLINSIIFNGVISHPYLSKYDKRYCHRETVPMHVLQQFVLNVVSWSITQSQLGLFLCLLSHLKSPSPLSQSKKLLYFSLSLQ